MPRRTIVLGRQPAQFEFQDDYGPLNNGIAYAAGQWLASGRDRAQIEAQQEEKEAARTQHQQERQQDVDFRTQDMELRRLALDQGQANRESELELRGLEYQRGVARDGAEAGAKLRDDIGAVGKYALDWMRGGDPAGAGRTAGGPTASSDLAREKFNYDRAVQEVGNPDYDLEVVRSTDYNGRETINEVKRPLSPQERASRVDRINARLNELNGKPFVPVPGFQADSGPIGPSAPVDGSLADLALGDGAPPAPGPRAPSATTTAPQLAAPAITPEEMQQVEEATTRATNTLAATAPTNGLPAEQRARMGMTDEQRTRLARTIADAKRGVPAAVRALIAWNARQADTIQRKAEDQHIQQSMGAGADAMDRANASGIH